VKGSIIEFKRKVDDKTFAEHYGVYDESHNKRGS